MVEFSQNSKIIKDLARIQSVPSHIFLNRNHTILEAIIVFLRERKKLSYRQIAFLLNRDHRFVYNSYANAKDKELITKYTISPDFIQIPISIFSNKKIPALEAIASYLKDELSLNYHEIAVLLDRDDRTIWTVYQRAKRKYGK